MTAKHGILRDHRYEGPNIAYKCKIAEVANLNTLWALVISVCTHVCTISKILAYIRKKKHVCQTRNPYVIINVKEQIQLPKMKCL